ncbi:MAG: Asp-tRNA(Asn)/Glu-tRNA(Gln) amidotransferase subunit GatC [Caldilineaceae bacterium]
MTVLNAGVCVPYGQLSQDEVRHVAELAKLQLTDAEVAQFTGSFRGA